MNYFSFIFKKILIIILHKSNKFNYIKSNIYKFIIFEYIIDKILENIITKLLNYLIKIYDLLFINHFKIYSQYITKNIIIILSENIYKA